jgi:hypothetical protein
MVIAGARVVQVDDDPEAIAHRIAAMDSVTGVWALAEQRLEAGDPAFVADLGIALWQQYGTDPAPPWQYRSVLDRMLRLLALTPGAVEQALRLIAVTQDQRRTRYAAALLASAHTASALAVFDGDATDELRACLLHELVLRGAEIQHPWVASPHWRDHPLAWLPRSLTPLEGRPSIPRYTIGASSHSVPAVTVEPTHGHGTVPPATETTTHAVAAAVGSAVANWAEESNGRIEARTFALDAEVEPDAVGDTLLSLGLDSLRGTEQAPGRCSATQAWQQLFAAASTGGAYNSGAFGAYGRLLAWRSVAALVDAPRDASPADVEALAQASSWYSFAEATDWFERVAWDLGLAVVSPDRRRLAVVAATDTD